MSTNNIKYLKDEQNNKISPVTSTSSVYTGGGATLDSVLSNVYQTETLFTGLTESNFKITKSVAYFDLIRIDYQVLHAYDLFDSMFINPPDDSFSTILTSLAYTGTMYTYILQIGLQFSNLDVKFNSGVKKKAQFGFGTAR